MTLVRIWTIDEAERQLECQAITGSASIIANAPHRVSLDDSSLGRIATSNQPRIENLASDPGDSTI